MDSCFPRLSIDVKADHSCNWRCCFDKNCPSDVQNDIPVLPVAPALERPMSLGKRQVSGESGDITTEKVVRVVEVTIQQHKHRRVSQHQKEVARATLDGVVLASPS